MRQSCGQVGDETAGRKIDELREESRQDGPEDQRQKYVRRTVEPSEEGWCVPLGFVSSLYLHPVFSSSGTRDSELFHRTPSPLLPPSVPLPFSLFCPGSC